MTTRRQFETPVNSSRLHGVTSKKTVLFIVTDLKTWVSDLECSKPDEWSELTQLLPGHIASAQARIRFAAVFFSCVGYIEASLVCSDRTIHESVIGRDLEGIGCNLVIVLFWYLLEGLRSTTKDFRIAATSRCQLHYRWYPYWGTG